MEVSVSIALSKLEEQTGLRAAELSLAHFFNVPGARPQALLGACDTDTLYRVHREAALRICELENYRPEPGTPPLSPESLERKRLHLEDMFEEVVHAMRQRGMRASFEDLKLPEWALEIEAESV